MHRTLLTMLIIGSLHAVEVGSVEIHAGTNYEAARNGLLLLGYKDTGLSMMPIDEKHQLMFMGNDKHVLIFNTNRVDKTILSISLYISDFAPKDRRFDRQYSVESINIQSGKSKMVLLLDK